MNFDLTEEQVLLRDSVRRFIDRQYGAEMRRQRMESREYFNSQVWGTFAEQGWLGAAASEGAGGYGGPVEGTLVAHELGRGLVLEPYVQVAILATRLLEMLKETSRLESLISGESIPVLAHAEAGARGLADITSAATKTVHGYELTGAKQQVQGGAGISAYLISARTAGARDDMQGISLFLVPSQMQGLRRRDYRLIDGTPVVDLSFSAMRLDQSALVGRCDEAYALIDVAYSHAITALCSQSVGAMERAVEITRDYLKTRKQFGVAIGSFQALQHRLADMVIHLEQARIMVYRALAYLDASPDQRHHAVAACKAQAGRSAKYVAAQAIQLHGGIGVTDEYCIGQYFKFLNVFESMFGSTIHQLAILANIRRASP